MIIGHLSQPVKGGRINIVRHLPFDKLSMFNYKIGYCRLFKRRRTLKILLILYPIEPIINVLVGSREPKENKLKIVKFYQKLMTNRYPDFQRVYIFFSAPEDLKKPDLLQACEGFLIEDEDVFGACGVTFTNHCQNRVYPKGKTILAACSEPIEKLVIGGFHFWDCVNKLARYSYGRGIDVSVDEDLTEFFFFSVKNKRGEPCLRIPVSLEESMAIKRNQLREAGEHYLEGARKARKGKPWMSHL
jgi:hypothetical protein